VLRDGAEVHWRTRVAETELVYPKNAPALLPGHTYQLEVTADKPGSPSSDSTRIVLLAPEDARPIQELEKRLKNLQLPNLRLPEEKTNFLVASLYARHGLYAEALARLALLPDSARVAAVERLWATLYLSIGLPLMAQEHANRAYTLSKEAQDVLGRLEAEELQGYVYMERGAHAEWSRWLRSALEGYRALGDSNKVTELQKQLAAGK
jgi:hypothetical protein